MGLFQAHFFNTRHLGLGRLPYLLEEQAKEAVLTSINPFGRPPFPSPPTLAHLVFQGTHSYK